jgi:hypothetical protein
MFVPQLLADIDQSKADDIIMSHDEKVYEVRITYISVDGTQKQFIYNYKEDSCTYDVYPDTFGKVTAAGAVDWQKDIAWEDDTTAWTSDDFSWDYTIELGDKTRITLMGLEGLTGQYPLIVDQGSVYTFDGDAYLSLCETVDFDFKSPEFWKYSDAVRFSLQVKQHLDPRPFKLYMQIGGRDSLDADIRWSDPQSIEVSGNGNISPKINIRKSGRYLRLRFYSQEKNIQWRISGYNLIARMGSTY